MGNIKWCSLFYYSFIGFCLSLLQILPIFVMEVNYYNVKERSVISQISSCP